VSGEINPGPEPTVSPSVGALPMWTCPKCGSKVDVDFDVCWSCGTSREGVEDLTFVRADDAAPDESPLELEMPEGTVPLINSPEPFSDLVECYLALDLMQAKFIADQLSERGIPAIADTDDMHTELGSMRSTPRVWVRAENLAAAREWLEAYDRQHKAEHHRGM
jgi:hypothetical protein